MRKRLRAPLICFLATPAAAMNQARQISDIARLFNESAPLNEKAQ
jgi:hypothetical protein